MSGHIYEVKCLFCDVSQSVRPCGAVFWARVSDPVAYFQTLWPICKIVEKFHKINKGKSDIIIEKV